MNQPNEYQINDLKPTLNNLKRITQIILAEESSYIAVRDACESLLNFFYWVTAFEENNPVNQQHLQSLAGQAVSPAAAAECIRDFMRTRVFLRGIKEAISSRLTDIPDKPVTVLYAGTGPFATLLIPLVTVFDASQLKMLLLDINSISITYLHKIIQHLGLQKYMLDIIESDAVSYRIPAAYQPDIIITETMMPALKTEPQISISANLLSQAPDAILIPELVEVSAALYNNKLDAKTKYMTLKSILGFTKKTAIQIAPELQKGNFIFPNTSIIIEHASQSNYITLALLTHIRVFNKHEITYNESSLTLPELVYDLSGVKDWPINFNIRYRITPLPGFVMYKDGQLVYEVKKKNNFIT